MKQSLSLCNGICAKLFEAKDIGSVFRFLNLPGFLELSPEFIETKYFAAGSNGIADKCIVICGAQSCCRADGTGPDIGRWHHAIGYYG